MKFKEGQVEEDMTYYLDKVLQGFPELKMELLPSKKDLFTLNLDLPSLCEKEKCFFHTIVAKLLYLSCRARPDIITTVSFCALGYSHLLKKIRLNWTS